MSKVKIIFDNNQSIVGENQPISNIFSSNIYKLKEFITQNKLTERAFICLTEVFKEEGIAELQTRTISKYHSARKSNELLSGVVEVDTIIVSDKDLIDRVKSRFDLKIKELNIEILPLPTKATILDLSKRAVSYKPPFERGDKGFKDSLAWLSILEDSETNIKFDYILVTKDGIFSNELLKKEFLSKNKKEVVVISADPIEEVLDEVLDLGFNLEKIKSEVLENIEKNDAFQSQLEKRALQDLNKLNHGIISASRFFFNSSYDPDWKKRIVNLIYKDATANIKNNISKYLFDVEVNVTFVPKYTDSDKYISKGDLYSKVFRGVNDGIAYYNTDNAIPLYPQGININNSRCPEVVKQKFTVSYDKKNSGFKIKSSEGITPGVLWELATFDISKYQ